MFNFNYDQGAGNNRCGGYSLAAIATNLRPNAFHDPINVYSDLRDTQVNNFQNNILNAGRDSRDLVAYTHQGGTDMLLPSTFFAAQYAQLNYELNMNQGILTQHLVGIGQIFHININANNVINEESATIGQNNIQHVQGDLQQFLQNDLHTYWLVLVNNATHWVAIERDPNGRYCIYNPAGRINAVANIGGDRIIYNGQVDNWSGIAISVA